MTTGPRDKPRVAVVYHFLPNYRQGVFDAMAAEPNWHIDFIAGHERPGQEGVPEVTGLDQIEVRNRWLKGTFLWQSGLLKQLREGGYDAVIFLGAWTYTSTWVAAAWARLSGRPVLFWTHGWITSERGVKGQIRRVFYRLSSKLLLYGDNAAAIGREYGWSDSDLVVVGNSLPLPDLANPSGVFIPDRVDDPTLPYVVWSSRVIESKDPGLAISAIGLAEKNGSPVNLVVIGDGPALELMTSQATKKCPGRVHFCGSIHDNRLLSSIFAGASATIVPDAGGLTIPHSLLHGVPVIANNDPTHNFPEYEFLDTSFNGSTFNRSDTQALQKQIHRWCYAEVLDQARRDRISIRAREQASPELGAQRILDAVADCL